MGWCALAATLAAAAALIGPAAAQDAAQQAAPASAAALPFDPDEATRQWLATMDQAAVARSNSYFEGGYWIQFVGPLIGFLFAFLFLQLGFAKNLRAGLEKSVKFYILVVPLFALAYFLIGTIVGFGWDYWVFFVREHDYNLSTQDFAQWFGEYMKGFGVNMVVGAIGITILYLIMRALPRTWWIWGAGASIVFVAVIGMLAPVYISPLFNTYTPMEAGAQKDDILHLAQASGVPAHDVMVFDVSRQSHRVTANVSGFLDTTRISLSDTLLERASPEAVRQVMGHEIGHYVLQHTVSILIMNTLLIVVVFALAHFVFLAISKNERWGIRGISDPAGMPLLLSIIGLIFVVATPINNNLIRFHEHQADIFGLNAAREPDGFAESALLLSEYRKMEPGPLEEWFFYDHPSGYARIHMAMVWKANEMAAGRIPMGPGGPPPGWRPRFVVVDEAQGAPPVSAATPEAAPAPAAQEPSPAAPSN
jgi:STE24 endopeptidase